MSVESSTVYVACGAEGVRVVDVSDPTNPTEVGFYDSDDLAWGVAVSGDIAYVADMEDGLYVLHFTGAVPTSVQLFFVSRAAQGGAHRLGCRG